MDFDQLRALATVAERRSFSRAADSLHLSQPAVSKRIAALEAELGVRLFDRVGRNVTLTDAGAALLPRARRMLDELEDSRRALSRLSDRVDGRLSLGMSHHVALHRLPDVLKDYAQRYPEVELELQFMDSEIACDAVLHGQLELAVVTLPGARAPTLATRVVWPDPLSIFVAREHPLAGRASVSVRELVDYPAVLPDTRTFTYRVIHDAFAGHGVEPQVRLSTHYLETLRMLVAVGLGWSALPATMADDRLRPVHVAGLAIERRLGVAWHRQRSRSAAAAAFLRLLPAADGVEPDDGRPTSTAP
ncbi:MAG TPA: LysR family transcriptional regulator [Nevskiaceae bacterium]